MWLGCPKAGIRLRAEKVEGFQQSGDMAICRIQGLVGHHALILTQP